MQAISPPGPLFYLMIFALLGYLCTWPLTIHRLRSQHFEDWLRLGSPYYVARGFADFGLILKTIWSKQGLASVGDGFQIAAIALRVFMVVTLALILLGLISPETLTSSVAPETGA